MNHAIALRFQKVLPSCIAQATGFYGAMETDLAPIAGNESICGPARTVWAMPGDSSFLDQLLPKVEQGDVIVIDAGGNRQLASVSAAMIGQLAKAGAAGVVVNGAVEKHVDAGIPVYAKSVRPKLLDSTGLYRIEVPVVCGGVSVETGDWIVGNTDGLICVKPEEIDSVLESAEAYMQG